MRLSEAIRLGSMLKPQGTMCLVDHGHTCALGAALDAIGELPEITEPAPIMPIDLLEGHWPILQAIATHPITDESCEVLNGIVDLNDCIGWTRERIADWVETLEPARQQADESATPVNAVREATGQPVLTLRA